MKCYHYNFVSIFNSPYGCAYCPDCGKRPLSVQECGAAILKPGFDQLAEKIAKELLDECPDPECIICQDLKNKYPHLR